MSRDNKYIGMDVHKELIAIAALNGDFATKTPWRHGQFHGFH